MIRDSRDYTRFHLCFVADRRIPIADLVRGEVWQLTPGNKHGKQEHSNASHAMQKCGCAKDGRFRSAPTDTQPSTKGSTSPERKNRCGAIPGEKVRAGGRRVPGGGAVLGPAVRDRSGVRAPVHEAEARVAVALARVRYLLRKPRTRACGATLRCVDRRLPAPGLQHVRFIKGTHCETLHRTLQVLAYFK